MKHITCLLLLLGGMACVSPGSELDEFMGIPGDPHGEDLEDSFGGSAEAPPATDGGVSDTPPLAGPSEKDDYEDKIDKEVERPGCDGIAHPETDECMGGDVAELKFDSPRICRDTKENPLQRIRAKARTLVPITDGKEATLVTVAIAPGMEERMVLATGEELTIAPADSNPKKVGYQLPANDDGTVTFQVTSTDKAGRFELWVIGEISEAIVYARGEIVVSQVCLDRFDVDTSPLQVPSTIEKIQLPNEENETNEKGLLLYPIKPSGVEIIEK